MIAVGSSSRRQEGAEKLCGVAKYIDDYKLPGCLYGVTLRSAIPFGAITGIRFDPKFPWHEFAIARVKDIPGPNFVTLIEKDQPLLTESRVMHAMEPILVLGHPIRERAYQALDHIDVEYQERQPVLTLEESIARRAVLYGSDNVFKAIRIEKGDVEGGLASADTIVLTFGNRGPTPEGREE